MKTWIYATPAVKGFAHILTYIPRFWVVGINLDHPETFNVDQREPPKEIVRPFLLPLNWSYIFYFSPH